MTNNPQGTNAAGSPDGRRRGSTQEKILEAAADVFAEKGYYATAVDDIVRASDTSKGSFYHFFRNKEGLFFTLVDKLSDLLLAGVAGAISQERGALNKVDAALRSVLQVLSRHKRLARIFLVEAAGLGHGMNRKLLEVHARLARLIQEHLDRAVAEGSIPPLDTSLAAYAWLGAINEIVVRWLYTGEPDPLEDALPELRRLLIRSIGVPLDTEPEFDQQGTET